jgi:GNAT superfamily N-acetyltransferase
MELRRAVTSDLVDIHKMAQSFHVEDGHPLQERSKEALAQLLLMDSRHGQIYLIYHENIKIGYTALCFTMSIEFGGLIIILDDFYISPEFRNKGFGKSVLSKIIEISNELKAVQIFLEVEYKNPRAQKLYEEFGFKIRQRNMMSLDLK